MIVTVTDIRRAGHCVPGIWRWFNAQGLDFRDFLTNGIDAEILAATKDGFADDVLKKIVYGQERRNS